MTDKIWCECEGQLVWEDKNILDVTLQDAIYNICIPKTSYFCIEILQNYSNESLQQHIDWPQIKAVINLPWLKWLAPAQLEPDSWVACIHPPWQLQVLMEGDTVVKLQQNWGGRGSWYGWGFGGGWGCQYCWGTNVCSQGCWRDHCCTTLWKWPFTSKLPLWKLSACTLWLWYVLMYL